MKIATVLDFETKSECDLAECGSTRYSEDPTTEILCAHFDDITTGERPAWHPSDAAAKTDADQRLRELAEDPDVLFVAHNAGFEKDIWRNIMVPVYGFPDIPDDRWHCTMAVCAQKGVAMDLDTAVDELGVPGPGKDMEGSALVKSLSKRNKKTGLLPEITPAIIERVDAYCDQDVVVERALMGKVGWLQPGDNDRHSEREVWLLDQLINQRGVKIDLNYVAQSQKIVDDATGPLAGEFEVLTGGLRFTQIDKLRRWCGANGVPLPDLKRERITALLGHDIDAGEDDEGEDDGDVFGEDLGGNPELPRDVRRALEIRHLVGSASIKKLGRMAACVCRDGRAHRLLQYHGAGPGRWAGRIFQPQNFPRPTLKVNDGKEDKLVSTSAIVDAILTGDHHWVERMIGPPVETVVQGLRHALIAAPGHAFISGDFEQIEARIVLALAGQHDKVELFVKKDPHPYADMACQIYKRPINKKNDLQEYTIGKNTVLGCGFQMGWKTFKARYCPLQTQEFAEDVIHTYRYDWAPKVPMLWRGLEEAALMTVYEGTPHESYGVEYRIEGPWMTARLPGGRKLFYYKPTKCMKEMPWSTPEKRDIRAGWKYLAIKNKMVKWVYAFGGHLTENVVQGLARDILVEATFQLEENGFPIVLTVHDEDLGEVPMARVDELAFSQIMCNSSQWVRSLRIPVGVETWVGDRYRK